MKNFSKYELILVFRGLRVLQFVLSGRDSAKCRELAEYFESLCRIEEDAADEQD